jgi:hypothetical protein
LNWRGELGGNLPRRPAQPPRQFKRKGRSQIAQLDLRRPFQHDSVQLNLVSRLDRRADGILEGTVELSNH